MKSTDVDVLILGSGFGGSLLAAILATAGRKVALVDTRRHPRFAIGESSTPLADKTLASIARRWDLPELLPLTHWGPWKREYPGILCGRKRGFTYLDQTQLTEWQAGNSSSRLLVTASVDDEHSDTHWLRSDVDSFFFTLAHRRGVLSWQDVSYVLEHPVESQWVLRGRTTDQPVEIRAPFVVDASGSSTAVLSALRIADQTETLRTNSRSVFAHFADTKTCEQILKQSGEDVDLFPFLCDDAAVHQVLPDGWMWQLRYDDRSLSAGFMIDQRNSAARQSSGDSSDPNEEWNRRIDRSAFLREQFAAARVIRPDKGLVSTGRIQRLAAAGAGPDWAALTNTVGFIDPLHSTGIAHTLFAVARLAEILIHSEAEQITNARTSSLLAYSANLISEIRCVDELVEGCYAALPSFDLWCQWGMLYFAAATSMEQTGATAFGEISFLRANDVSFRQTLSEARVRLGEAATSGCRTPIAQFSDWLRIAIAPWNQVGLFNPDCRNLYETTAAPANAW